MRPPPPAVLAAFGITDRPTLLEGGRGTSWRAGEAVLKPLDVPEEQLAWQETTFASIADDGFRLARPLRTRDGALTVEGWCAWEFLAGRHERGRWAEIIAVGERFHAALAGIPCPAFVAARTDPWAVADRVAWGDLPVATFAHVEHVTRLAAASTRVADSRQVVHSDLTGNVLFDDHLPPAVIDVSPLFRPRAYASAIVVADALVWEGAGEGLLDAVRDVADFGQYLLRALIFRAVADHLLRSGAPRAGDDDPYRAAVDVACRLAAAG